MKFILQNPQKIICCMPMQSIENEITLDYMLTYQKVHITIKMLKNLPSFTLLIEQKNLQRRKIRFTTHTHTNQQSKMMILFNRVSSIIYSGLCTACNGNKLGRCQ